jgi:anti-anti-sigma regulatory factor
MATIAVLLKLDEQSAASALREASKELQSAEGEVAVDFSSIRKIDASALKALEELAGQADAKGVKVRLRGVNVDIYKTLILVRLAPRFSFVG